ncbi:c-type cytochrome [Sphingomonas crocodyli]|uniref:C-type cytochrome n=1 Tax=Sphingomonas crocodyli TaxID=1979270 RepID=A0A437M614_9SPHN|nr:c-type cytochrome [Sphingomonas crocodyli]RVT93005.1 c-type cytochrome [Sphingomonas crocodyli]
MTIRLSWKRVVLVLVGLLAAGMLFAWSGAMQVSASSGHWRITDWFLHWVMRNSVRTYAAFQAPEKVRDDTSLVSAAGHFRQACQVCHGAPGIRPSPVMQAATPPAPDLALTAREWSDAQLFWIIRHGVKFTAMPAWPAADREDEIRRMTAFVRRLPDMTPTQYRALIGEAGADEMAGLRPGLLASCTGCHGADGRGRGQADIPILGGQKPDYLAKALEDYASGKRQSAVMQVAAAALTTEEMGQLARHFAAMPGLTDAPPSGHKLLTQGGRSRQLPACANCHRPTKGAPLLSGQRPVYVAERLRAWQGDPTVVDARKSADTMATIARRIPSEEVDDVARAIAEAPRRN